MALKRVCSGLSALRYLCHLGIILRIVMNLCQIMPILLLLTSCTYSINQIHTKGSATDVIDETQEASPTVSPNVKVSTV